MMSTSVRLKRLRLAWSRWLRSSKSCRIKHEDAIRAQGRANRELSDAKTDLTVAKERATSIGFSPGRA